MEKHTAPVGSRAPWNKGTLTGQKPPLKLPEVWAIRPRLQMSSNFRELAMFNLAIDSKLRACDLARLLVQDICQGAHVGSRAMVMQQKTQRPVQFEITEEHRGLGPGAWTEVCRLSFPKPLACVAASVDTAIRPTGSSVGRRYWT